MPFGFGFNKAKVLASAEKNVKAGKLQNAIADYEKIVKEDPKDLTVLNTIGDLYARLGNTDQATRYYKQVGDAFATNGFTVKAIAMYKKVSKLDSSVESLTRLADLYAAQNLHNDARQQYILVAEQHLKSGNLDKAATVFQKVLDLDPENAAMQAKLAELYVRLGKKNEARDIYYRNAELYRTRKNFAGADDSLNHALAIDKTFSQGILLRGLVKMELGDAASAVQCFEQVPDIDARPEVQRGMLKAYFKLGKLDAAGPLTRKIYSVSHEPTELATYGAALLAANHWNEALALYTEFADVLLATPSEDVIKSLQGCIAQVKDNPAGLEQLAGLLERAGQTTHLAEIKELLAHASVQSGDLVKARELYRELAKLEPDNPLHTQNYRQVLAKLGEDPSARPLSAEEAAQPMLADELEGAVPEIPQDYTPEMAEAVRAALTEAELFDSYNLPGKAITPLEAVLSRVPQDPQVNQRLASLYARTGRLADAGSRCRVLSQVYKQAGYSEQSHEYAELATKYGARGGSTSTPPRAPATSAPTPAPAVAFEAVHEKPSTPAMTPVVKAEPAASISAKGEHSGEKQTGSVAEFEFTPSAPEPITDAHATPAAFQSEFASSTHAPAAHKAEASQPEAPAVHEPAPAAHIESKPAPAAHVEPPRPAAAPSAPVAEFDLSSEWEDMVEVDEVPAQATAATPAPAEPTPQQPAPAAVVSLEPQPAATAAAHTPRAEEPAVQPAEPALDTEPVPALAEPVPDADAAIFEMLGATPESGYPERVADLIEEIRFYMSQGMWDEAQAGVATLAREAPEAAADLRREIAAQHGSAPAAPSTIEPPPPAPAAHHELFADLELEPNVDAVASEPIIVEPEPVLESIEIAASTHDAAHETADAAHAPAHSEDTFESLLDLDSALGDDFEIAPAIAAAPAHAPSQAHAAAAAVAAPPTQVVAASAQTGQAVAVAPAIAPPQTAVAPPPPVAVPVPEPVVAAAPSTSVPASPSPLSPITEPLNDTALNLSDGALADIFADFKHDMESGTASNEDPETHYNLGVAFKEMGLLDEAIGELQKVCQAIDRGEAFPQALQAYTWLADCFVQKGVPEAAIRWYEKALRSAHVEAETATAIHYEMACALEQAGNRDGALTHFMEVYGTNIDYRDVAERIKSLKS